MVASVAKELRPLHPSVQITSFHLPPLYSITPYITRMTSRHLICPPLSRRHIVRRGRGAFSSISGQSSSSGIHQVLPTSFIRTSPFFLSHAHFQPERNLSWHARLLETLSPSFPIILIQLWWGLILLCRRRGVKSCLFYMSLAVRGWPYLHARRTATFNHLLFPFPSLTHTKNGPEEDRWVCINSTQLGDT